MAQTQKLLIDKDKIETAIRMGVPITVTSYTLPKEMETYIADVITEFLKQLHHSDMVDYVVYCSNELSTNAKKANTKRCYFKEKSLDISKQNDYELGMSKFKEDTLSNLEYYLTLQKKAGLYVKVSMQVVQDNFILEISNNSPITQQEFKRIFDRLVRARQFSSLDEVFTQVLDSSEGAGLGLVIMVLMLKKLGLSEKAFTIDVVNGVTISRVTIPLSTGLKKQAEPLTRAIVEYINEIPQFPENIMQIQRAINDPDSNMQQIATLISGDIGLATDLLKCVNSTAFGLVKPCMDIAEAVKLMGLRGIQNLLYSVGTVKLLETNESEQRQIWEDAYKLAFFSFNTAKLTGKRNLVENAYVCGLLHNLGKIILQLMYPELMLKLAEIQAERNISPQVMDMIMSGMEQAEIGAALAEKWHFPTPIVITIRYKNNFEAAPEEYRELVETIRLADFMLNYSQGNIEFYQIPKVLLDKFKIKTEEQLKVICKRFEEAADK
ncbi:ATP-binding protein [Treponema pedis]|uniref:ATP-binding protein n=1 Tax=Treponema pedis TaxID=409322 RepID=UPI003133FDEF